MWAGRLFAFVVIVGLAASRSRSQARWQAAARSSLLLGVAATLVLAPVLVGLLSPDIGDRATVVAFDPATGTELWRTRPNLHVLSFAVVSDEVISLTGTREQKPCQAISAQVLIDRRTGKIRLEAEPTEHLTFPKGTYPTTVSAYGGRLEVRGQELIRTDDAGERTIWTAALPRQAVPNVVGSYYTMFPKAEAVLVVFEGRVPQTDCDCN
jgi:outer membrane protein assembly factor BamB